MMHSTIATTAAIGIVAVGVAACTADGSDTSAVSQEHLYRNEQPHAHAQVSERAVEPSAPLQRQHLYRNEQPHPHAQIGSRPVEPDVPIQRQHLYRNEQPHAHAEPMAAARDRDVAKSADIAPDARQQQRMQDRSVSINGQQLAAASVIGRPVVTPAGDRFGEVVKISSLQGAGETFIISIDEENRQATIEPGTPEKLSGQPNMEPVIVGSSMAAVHGDGLRPAGDGRSLVVGQSSLRPVDRSLIGY